MGLPSPPDLTGGERWSPDGKLYRNRNLELDVMADQKSWNAAVDGVV
jgi:hypothetical protein